jgi:hypothetical protein
VIDASVRVDFAQALQSVTSDVEQSPIIDQALGYKLMHPKAAQSRQLASFSRVISRCSSGPFHDHATLRAQLVENPPERRLTNLRYHVPHDFRRA